MKTNLILLLRLFRKFGIKPGGRLFLNIKFGKLNNLKIPAINKAVSLRKGSSDLYTFYQIFLHNEYEINFNRNPKVIIDGGANIGLFTVLMKQNFPNAKFICVEPDVENYQLLQKNVSEYTDVHCENSGLWGSNAMLKVYDKYNKGKWGIVAEENNEEGTIRALPICDLMKKYSIDRIDILKLDIETSEKELFSKNYECWLPKTKMLIVELHDFMLEGCSKAFFEAIQKTFKSYEYTVNGENTIIINHDIP